MYFDSYENARNRGESASVNSHYMTIIGYSKYLKDDGLEYEYILKVVSWGGIYFINYDDYAKKLSYFSNILEVRE